MAESADIVVIVDWPRRLSIHKILAHGGHWLPGCATCQDLNARAGHPMGFRPPAEAGRTAEADHG